MAERLQTIDRRQLAYDCQFDIDSWQNVCELEDQIPPQEYAQLILNWQRETKINLETNLGERFNAQMFEVKYPLQTGRMMHPFKNLPALDMVVDGQQYRLGDDSKLNHNQKRELAEVVSFSAVESYFLENPQSTEKLIVPSPPGGVYAHNFIDVFDLFVEDGRSSVRLRRFATSISLRDHLKIAQKLTGQKLTANINPQEIDIELKSNVIATQKSTTEILALYTPDQTATDLADCEKLKAAYRPLALNYIENIMRGEPTHKVESLLLKSYKFADVYMGKDTYANPAVRVVQTGCGIQPGSGASRKDLIYTSLFSSILASGEDQYGTLEIHCQECGTTYQRTPGKLEEKCRFCGGTRGIIC